MPINKWELIKAFVEGLYAYGGSNARPQFKAILKKMDELEVEEDETDIGEGEGNDR